MAEKIAMDAALLQRIVGFMSGAGTQLQKQAEDREQAEKKAAEAVEALIEKGLLGQERKQAAVELLTDDHIKALDTIHRTAAHVKSASVEATPPASMGGPADTQKRASSATEEADQKFLSAFGLA